MVIVIIPLYIYIYIYIYIYVYNYINELLKYIMYIDKSHAINFRNKI